MPQPQPIDNADPRRLLVGLKRVAKPPVLAARLSGTLDSAFPDGAPAPAAGTTSEAAPAAKTETLKRSVKPLNVILVGDADMLMDRNWIQQQSCSASRSPRRSPTTAISSSMRSSRWPAVRRSSDLRGRGVSWRPFELIQRMEAEADQRYRAKEQELTQQLKDTEQKLAQMPKRGRGLQRRADPGADEGDRRASAPSCWRSAPQLRDVQFALRRNVDDLKSWVTAVNVGVGAAGGGDHRVGIRNAPAAAAGAGQGRAPIMNARQLIVLAGLAIVSVAATAAVMKTNATTVASDRRGEAVLPALRSQANELASLTIRDGDTTFADRTARQQLRLRRRLSRQDSTRYAKS